MKEILKLLKLEFKKNLNFKKIIAILIIVLIGSFITKYLYELTNPDYEDGFNSISVFGLENVDKSYQNSLTKYQEDPSYENLISLEHNENFKYIQDNYNDFGKKYLYKRVLIRDYITKNFEIRNYKLADFNSNIDNSLLIKEKEEQLEELENLIFNAKLYELADFYIEDYEKDIEKLTQELNNLSDSKEKALKENQIYNLERKIELLKIVKAKKIEDTLDFRGELAMIIFDWYIVSLDATLISESEFETDIHYLSEYQTYDNYVKKLKVDIERNNNFFEFVLYGIENNIYPQINRIKIEGYSYNTKTTKDIIDNVYYLGILSLVITLAFFGNILIKEHNSGTYKMLLMNSKRSNLIIAKFLFLTIIFITTYLISFGVFTVISILSYGISNLSIPHLEILSGKIRETNYILYTLKNIFFHMVILIIYLALLMFISTFSFKQVITSGLTMISLIIMLFFKNTNYFVPLFATNYKYLDVPVSVIISSIIYILLFLIIAITIYKKKDLKN